MNNSSLVGAGILVFVIAAPACAQREPPNWVGKGNMRLTNSESLWTGRFSDCDFRYYVLLPNGFVGHANRPPERLHGLLFALPDTSATDVVTFDDDRVVSVMAHSNELEFKSLKDITDHVLASLSKEKSGFEIKVWELSRLDGEPAAKLRVEYNGPDGRIVEEELISLRLGVLYEIGLRTTAAHYDVDDQNFAKVVAGFRFWKNYRCYGTNNNP